jgi:hypothetical protein
MLRAIRDHLRAAGPLTLDQIAGRFDMDKGAAEGALTLLVRRGDVAAEPLQDMCRGCAGACSGSCGRSRILVYRAADRRQ